MVTNPTYIVAIIVMSLGFVLAGQLVLAQNFGYNDYSDDSYSYNNEPRIDERYVSDSYDSYYYYSYSDDSYSYNNEPRIDERYVSDSYDSYYYDSYSDDSYSYNNEPRIDERYV